MASSEAERLDRLMHEENKRLAAAKVAQDERILRAMAARLRAPHKPGGKR